MLDGIWSTVIVQSPSAESAEGMVQFGLISILGSLVAVDRSFIFTLV